MMPLSRESGPGKRFPGMWTSLPSRRRLGAPFTPVGDGAGGGRNGAGKTIADADVWRIV